MLWDSRRCRLRQRKGNRKGSCIFYNSAQILVEWQNVYCSITSRFLGLISQQTTALLQRAVIYAQPGNINPIHRWLKPHLPFLISLLTPKVLAQKKKITLEASGWHGSLRWCKIRPYSAYSLHKSLTLRKGWRLFKRQYNPKEVKCPSDPEKSLFNLVPGLYTTHETDSVAWRPAPAECSLNEAQASSDSWFYFRSPPWFKKKYRMDVQERLGGQGGWAFFSLEVVKMPLSLCHSRLTDAVRDTVWGGRRLLSPARRLKELLHWVITWLSTQNGLIL